MPRPICLITGVGPGTGTAIARRFSEKYDGAMLARNRDRLANLRNENKEPKPKNNYLRLPYQKQLIEDKV